jgi:hypothetical protein
MLTGSKPHAARMRLRRLGGEWLGPEPCALEGDAEPAGELLVGQEAGHRGIAEQDLGLVGVEGGDQLW